MTRRLLIIASEFPPGPGGIGTHAYQIAWRLHRLGWPTSVLSPQDYAADEEIAAFNRAQPFPVTRLASSGQAARTGISRWRALNRHIAAWRPELILASGQRSVWLAAALARLHRLPWAAVGHGSEFGPAATERVPFTRLAFNQAAAVICVSNFTCQQMEKAGIQPQRSRVIPNGADHEVFQAYGGTRLAEVRKRLGITGPLIATVGNISERKGQDIVIRALPQIAAEFPAVQYAMIGLPTRRAEMESLAESLGVARRCHFTSRVTQVELVDWLNASDIFAMTSRETPEGDVEGYGIAVVEAALCGKPALVAAGSGLEEAVLPGETGIVIPQNDPQAAAQALLTLLRDETRRLHMGQAARLRALREQTWEQCARTYADYLEALAAGCEKDG